MCTGSWRTRKWCHKRCCAGICSLHGSYEISFMPPYCSLPHSCPGTQSISYWASKLQTALWALRVLLPGYKQGLLHTCDHNLPFHGEELPDCFCTWLTFSTPSSLSERLRSMLMGETVSLKGQLPTLWREAEEQTWEDQWERGSPGTSEKKDSKNIPPLLYQTPFTCPSQKRLVSEYFSWHQDSMSSVTAATQLKSRHTAK